MTPEEQPAGNGNLLHPGDYKLGNLLEIAFASLHFPRIDIISFEMGEVELDGGGVVAVRPGEQDRELELLIQLQAVAGRLVRRVVDQDHGVLPPGWSLIV